MKIQQPLAAAACALAAALAIVAAGVSAQTATRSNVPTIPFDSSTDFLKITPDMNFGEVLGIAVNSKGHVVVLNHQGSTSAPLYGNASTQLLEFDQAGKFVREIGKGVYGLGYSHSVRFDKYDNLWVVDKGTNAVVRFNPAGYVTLNLGRRPEGPDDPAEFYYRPGRREPPVHVDGMFRQPTDVAWDSDDNIYVSDGYTNSRIAKFDKRGNWVKSWGSRGSGGVHADENPGQFNTPHSIAIDRQNNVYVADRGNPPDETAPWTLCITSGPTQYLFTTDQEPGRLYKLSLDGTIVGMLGESGRDAKQFNWVHGLACPSEEQIFVADMNNWRVQRLTLHADRAKPSTR
jgi:hypothetical protein